MPKPYFLVLVLLIVLNSVSAQVHKVYIMSNGSETTNISKAVAYVLYHKMEGDSAWAMSQYDLHDTITISGTFKDERLTIPHGKFTFYRLIQPSKQMFYSNDTHRKESMIDSGGNFIDQTGVYLNGKKNGVWKSYNHNKIAILNTYKDDVLDGLYQSYSYSSGKVAVEGNYINNVRQGDWNSLSYYGEVLRTEVYKDGVIIKNISYLDDKKFNYDVAGKSSKYDIIAYLNLKLQGNKFNSPGKYHAQYSFNLSADGKLISAFVIERSIPEIDNMVVSQLLVAPNWEPIISNEVLKTFVLISEHNSSPDSVNNQMKMKYIAFDFNINIDKKGQIHISYPDKTLYRYD